MIQTSGRTAVGPAGKQKFPAGLVRPIAEELIAALTPFCEPGFLCAAGSFRRQKPEVGDLEILLVPRIECRAETDETFGALAEMFATPVDRAAEALLDLCAIRFIEARVNTKGHRSWGPLIKLARHYETGVPIDFFTATKDNWWNYLVCRTGPAESNVAIASAAQKRGWKWEPYSSGFVRLDGSERAVMTSEQAVFEFVRLPYREPEKR